MGLGGIGMQHWPVTALTATASDDQGTKMTSVATTLEDVPPEAIAEAFQALRNDVRFERRMAAIPTCNAAARQAAFRDRFTPVAEAHGVSVDDLLRALARVVRDPDEREAPVSGQAAARR